MKQNEIKPLHIAHTIDDQAAFTGASQPQSEVPAKSEEESALERLKPNHDGAGQSLR